VKIFVMTIFLFSSVQTFAGANVDSQLAQLSQRAKAANRPKGKGYKLQHVEPGSVYDNLGLKAGDVITGVKGVKVSNPEEAMETFNIFKNDANKEQNYEN